MHVYSFFSDIIELEPGAVGLALSYAVTLTGMFQWGVRQSAEVENMVRTFTFNGSLCFDWTSLNPFMIYPLNIFHQFQSISKSVVGLDAQTWEMRKFWRSKKKKTNKPLAASNTINDGWLKGHSTCFKSSPSIQPMKAVYEKTTWLISAWAWHLKEQFTPKSRIWNYSIL